MWFFVNGRKLKGSAPKRTAGKTRTARKGRKRMARRKQSAAQRRASLKNLAKARRARGGPAKRRRRRNPPPGGVRTAVWRSRKHKARKYSYGSRQKRVIRTNPRHRRRHYRRNPGFSIGGIGNQLIGAGKLVGGIYLGKGVTNFVSAKIPVAQTGWMGYAVKLGVGLVGTMGVRKFLGPEWAKAFLAGAIMSVVDPMAKSLPIIGPSLGDDDMGEYVPVGYDYPAVGAYETSVGESVPVGAYETSVGMY